MPMATRIHDTTTSPAVRSVSSKCFRSSSSALRMAIPPDPVWAGGRTSGKVSVLDEVGRGDVDAGVHELLEAAVEAEEHVAVERILGPQPDRDSREAQSIEGMLEIRAPAVLSDVLQHLLPDPDVGLEDEVGLDPLILGDLGHVDQGVELERGLEVAVGALPVRIEDRPDAAAVDLTDVFMDGAVLLHQLTEPAEPFG